MTLDEFIRGRYFEMWDCENRSAGSPGMILSNPERFDRCQEAAGRGAEGSTHAELLQDWRDALFVSDLSDEDKTAISREIDECELWHERNGSLESEVG